MSIKTKISVSVVIYKNKISMLKKLFDSLLNTDLEIKIFVIDNSPNNEIEKMCKRKEFVYIFNNKNVGFGSGHNIAIKKILSLSKYHLIINPDVYFEKGSIEKMYDFMENNSSISIVIPKVKDWNDSSLYFCRLLPTPFDLFLRRFGSPFVALTHLVKKRNTIYELSFTGYNTLMDIPCFCGCCFFVRSDIFKKIGLFDERFFMYLEDFDLARRAHKHYRITYYPDVTVYHKYSKGSYKEFKLLIYHICSAIKYFNKWGWFFDRERKQINNTILNKLKKINNLV